MSSAAWSCTTQCLIRVNPETGALVEVVSSSLLAPSPVLGLAYKNGALCGVDDAGRFCVLEPGDDSVCPAGSLEDGVLPTSYTGATTEP